MIWKKNSFTSVIYFHYFIGWRGGRGYKLAPFKQAVVDYAKNNIKVAPVDDEGEADDVADNVAMRLKKLEELMNEQLNQNADETL